MDKENKISIGDIVQVDFHVSQSTLCRYGKVQYIPNATGDSWIIENLNTGEVYYISEGCTITKRSDSQNEEL
jgi:hypothetical protein